MTDLVVIDYTNYRGDRFRRTVRPIRIWFGENEYHSPAQWLLDADDISKGEPRTFALTDVHSWCPADEVAGQSAAAT